MTIETIESPLASPPQQLTNSATLATGQYKDSGMMIFRNGVLLTDGLDFTRVGGLVTMVAAPQLGDILTAKVFARGRQLGGATAERYIAPWSFPLIGSYDGLGLVYQVQFGPTISGACDGVNNVFAWSVGFPRIKAFRNGLLQTFGIDIYAGPASLVFLTGSIPQAGDLISILGYSS